MELADKLQVKDQGLNIINAPASVALDLDHGDAGVLVFVRNQDELEKHAGPAFESARSDRLTWIAYPKAGKLETDLNRDRLWEAVADQGIRPVRQISIDDTWSALRFRPGRLG